MRKAFAAGYNQLFRNVRSLMKGANIFPCHENICAIDALKIAGTSSLEERQYHMVGYLIELAYDLAIGTGNEVSASPGFEIPLGAWISD